MKINYFYEYLLVMVGCGAALPPEEKEALEKWERENLGRGHGEIGTADWPGWVRYIGPPPRQEEQKPQKREGRVYLIRNEGNGFVKIGFSKHPDLREKTLQSQEPNLVLIGSISGSQKTEKALHQTYRDQHIRGEWFKLSEADILEILD